MTRDAGDPSREATAWQPDRVAPTWPAPARVHAFVTTRNGGVSTGPWGGASGGGLNLGARAGDLAASVDANRRSLARHLPGEPAWLDQVHGTRVVDAGALDGPAPVADAAFTSQPGVVCAILVADCMPVLLAHRDGSRVAAAHAGWRGLAAGVLEATFAAGGFVPAETVAWIGPAIGPACFEVGDDVRDAFAAAGRLDGPDRANPPAPTVLDAFVPHGPGKWLADLPALARSRLASCGVTEVRASGLCTMSDPDRFYSYRRDGVTGRMAALIWIDD